jgi:hypothetical protein
MDSINPLFTATATAIGGRNGHTKSSDRVVKADLSVPKAMGGPGKPGTATPELGVRQPRCAWPQTVLGAVPHANHYSSSSS